MTESEQPKQKIPTRGMNSASKKKIGEDNYKWGQLAEQIAAEYLLKKGYTIRERNWRAGKYEIDIILECDRTIIFVEVKARKPDTQDPIDAVGKNKRSNIVRGADCYLRNLPHLYQYRFDIITIIGDSNDFKLEHYEDAYMPGVNGR